MSNEVSAAKIRLNELIRRRDDIEKELLENEAQEAHHETVMNNNQMRSRIGVTRQSSLPAKLHQREPSSDPEMTLEFPEPETFYSQDNHLDNPEEMVQDTQGWLFSPRSATPTSEYPEQTLEPPDPAAIARHKKQNPKIVINVGGVKHEIMWKMLEKR